MVESDEINEEITSGEDESPVDGFARCDLGGRVLLRRASKEDCGAPCAVGIEVSSKRSMASNNDKDVQRQ